MIKHTYIEVVRRGDDCGQAVQYAYDSVHAHTLIDTIMPPLNPGYYYRVVTI